MMKEEATLYDQILTTDADGKLVSSPSYSPEHGPKDKRKYIRADTGDGSLAYRHYSEAAGNRLVRTDDSKSNTVEDKTRAIRKDL